MEFMYNGSLGHEQFWMTIFTLLRCVCALRLFDYIEGIKSRARKRAMNLYYDAHHLSLTLFVFRR
jgi:hypothetical protein